MVIYNAGKLLTGMIFYFKIWCQGIVVSLLFSAKIALCLQQISSAFTALTMSYTYTIRHLLLGQNWNTTRTLSHTYTNRYTQIPLLISKTEFLRRKNAYEYNEPFKQNHTVSLEMQKKTTNKTTEKWAPQYILHCRRKQKNSIILTHSMSLYQIEFLCMYMYEKERTIRSNNSKNENKLNE